ncbi:MAG: VCBS repeat-containing protein [Pirellulales bacterium]|nr:VCBS repeat-containing protein [Pirellulales bacterium]
MRIGSERRFVPAARIAISPRLRRPSVWLLGVAVGAVCAIGARAQDTTPSATNDTSGVTAQSPATIPDALGKALAEFNRGAALMEQYQYSDAAAAFEAALKFAPDWIAARFNLGVAHFNMHGKQGAQDYLNASRDAFLAVLASQPDHLHARFCLGLHYQHLGDNEAALEHFRAVHEGDPSDPHAAYKYAETLIGLGRNEEGTKVLEKVVALDPGFISAVYRLAIQYTRSGRRDLALPLFERFRDLKTAELTGGSFIVQKTYATAGKYYLALGADSLPLVPPGTTERPRIVFSPETITLPTRSVPWKWAGGSVNLPGIAAGDVDGDGDQDLCLTAQDEQGTASLWLNDGAGRFRLGPMLASHAVSPCFGDVDNDGDLDLWLGCAGPDVLLENDGHGAFRPTAVEGLAGPDHCTTCARLLDVDSDGDLDLLALRLAAGSVPVAGQLRPAASSVYNNNRDGSMTDLAVKLGLEFSEQPVAAVVYDDFDDDRDLDLMVFPAGGNGPLAWVNDRVWKYRLLAAEATHLAAQGVVAATSGDPNKDGKRDLLVFTGKAVHLYVNRGGFRFEADRGFAEHFGPLGGTGGQFADVDNDGDLDVVIADAHRRDGTRGPVLLVNDLPRGRFLDAAELDPGFLPAAVTTPGGASCVVGDFTGNGRCDLLLAPTGEKPLLLENLTPGGHWIQLDLQGTREKDGKSRSNNSAIGARVEIKTGTVFQQFTVGVPCGPVAMPPLRIHAGLGSNPKVDWLRIFWPDAVLQAELELAADRVTAVTELARKTSSCPLLFAFDGSRFEFVSDFGGVGGLGYFLAPGVYAPPDPTEYLPLPRMQPEGGQYVLQTLTRLEEVTYFDEAKLIAVDHPAGTRIVPSEMMAISVPPPRFEVFCYRETIEPVRAVDHRGVDVTEPLRRIDRRYAGAAELDPRFAGIAEDHFVELDFGDRLDGLAADSRLILLLYGWVEYGYSSTNFAAFQAGVRAEAPSIEVWRNGRWVELFREVGYPAGLQHVMTLEVTGKLLPGDRRIRISSNMEIYWDRIFLARHLAETELRVSEVAAGSADLHFRGYPREYSPDGRHPNLYDYGNVDGATAWKLMGGDYTRYGEVGELLEAADDCFVIIGRGEELTLCFPAEGLGPVPPGCQRSLLLKTDSFCKDMDLYTAHPDTVEPLPFHAMSGYPYGPDEHYPDNDKTRDYRRRYNTRRVRAR